MKLVSFEKKLGLAGATAITVGAVIGVGIFVIVGPMGANSGPWMPVVFVVSAIPAALGSMVAVALGSTIPADGGGFYYTRQLFNRYIGTITSMLVIMGAVGAMMTVSIGVADYLRMYFPSVPRAPIAIAMILLTWAVNQVGIMASVGFQIVTVVQLITGILLVIIPALLAHGHPDFSQPAPAGVSGLMQASVIAMLTYTGWNIIGEMGDEIENPRRNVPLTIIFGLGIVALLYTGIGWVVSGTLSVAQMKTSHIPVMDTAMQYLPGWTAHYINLAAFGAAITSVNAVFLVVPREFSALSEDGILPKWIMKFNPKRQTFPVAIAIIAVAGSIMTFLGLEPDLWGMICVAGLLGANIFISLGVFRLFQRFPQKVADSPLSIKKWWAYPAAGLSALCSVGFAAMSFWFFRPGLIVAAVLISIGLFLARKSRSV